MQRLYRDFETQAQIDAQYNPSMRLAAGALPQQHYTAQATQARASLRAVLDVPYGPTLAETLDIFPADAPAAPVCIFLHGGYWRAFSSKDFSGVALGLHARGITTVVVNYALCPWVRIDEIVRQCRSACAWVLRNIDDHGGDCARVALSGHSAGAQLAAMCLSTPWQRDYGLADDPFAAAVLVSGIYDLAPLRYSYLQAVIQLDADSIARNAPVLHARACRTPLWLTWGQTESEEFARQSGAYHHAWSAQGNRARLEALPGADHFSAIHGFESGDSALSLWLQQQFSA